MPETWFSSAMQRRDKQDVVAILELVLILALQLPVRIVDQDEDAWSSI
jgi:hypothetical protein